MSDEGGEVGGDARKGVDRGRVDGDREAHRGRWQEVCGGRETERRQPEFWRCSTAEGELPRTRRPNPLFWTHTPASRLCPNHLHTISSLHRILPTGAFPTSAAAPTSRLASPFPPQNGRHGTLPGVLRCCLPRHPDVQFCITIRRALRKLPRNFSFPSR